MSRSKFYQFFPPPQLLQMSAVGLDISDASVRFAELLETRDGFVIGRYGERPIPRGIIESGEVKKPTDLRAILTELKKAYNLEFAIMSLPEEKAYLFDLHLPKMKYSEIRDAIELVLEERVPLKNQEALFDYEIEKETKDSIHLAVSAVSRVFVDGYLEAFSGTGITPTAFEIEAQSTARAIIPMWDMGPSMIVDFGKTRTGIAIVSNGVVRFTSTLPIGGTSLTDIIARKFGIPFDEAEKLKREKGVVGERGKEDLSLTLTSTISILRDEIKKHCVFWRTHDDYGEKPTPIQKIYLCGGDSNLSGFSDYLSKGLGIPISLGNVMVNVNSLEHYVPEINFSDSLRYATAIGLALRRLR
ncbi:MAG: pilus assembly protein PilM [Candidatus Pacebacteria bacterium]|nr:pilus assembly protein PilM [Candidatus Paceibacterota bacterium]